MLAVENLDLYYGDAQALAGVSLEVPQGSIVAIVGANGAGKTTTLKAISGILRAERGEVCKGSIEFGGERIDGLPPHDIVKRGIVQVFEGRRVFEHLTVEENLTAGGHTLVNLRGVREGIDLVYTYFPVLKERRSQQSGHLSGGEQQMLAIGRGLMSRPKLVMLDEPSLGLAPLMVQEVLHIIHVLNERGLTVLLVEQNVAVSLKISDRAYVLENGRVVMSGSGEELLHDDRVRQAYMGL